ncbi:hypothetical protein GCM10010420_14600 [Streptomyces glaucosporus]|uniref:Uncharacterized protein n=1 Tax=Streptomyces glaucosporus TaxID=284044 RepID=A0ABN3I003_9ACTN
MEAPLSGHDMPARTSWRALTLRPRPTIRFPAALLPERPAVGPDHPPGRHRRRSPSAARSAGPGPPTAGTAGPCDAHEPRPSARPLACGPFPPAGGPAVVQTTRLS